MRTQVLIGATFGDNITAWFSNFGYHDVAISLATVHNAILKGIAPEAELDVANYPIEGNYERNVNNEISFLATTCSTTKLNVVVFDVLLVTPSIAYFV